MIVKQNPSGYHLFFGETRLSSDAARLAGLSPTATRRLDLADGRYVAQVTGPFYQTATLDDIVVPMPNPNAAASGAPYHFDLLPGWGYPFPNTYPLRPDGLGGPCAAGSAAESLGPTLLRGSLHRFDGTPAAEARVSLVGVVNSPTYTTDDTGQWVLVFPAQQATRQVTVRVVHPSGATLTVPGVCIIRGRDTSLFETALRGWVRRQGRAVGHATVEVAGQPQPVTTDAAGAWAYYFDLDQASVTVDVTARLPDGASLTASNVPVQARGTTVVPTFNFA